MSKIEDEQEGFTWQVGVWDRMSSIYLREVDHRFTSVVDAVIRRAALRPGEQVFDLGAGTGSVAVEAASLIIPGRNAGDWGAAGRWVGAEQHHVSGGPGRGDTGTVRQI